MEAKEEDGGRGGRAQAPRNAAGWEARRQRDGERVRRGVVRRSARNVQRPPSLEGEPSSIWGEMEESMEEDGGKAEEARVASSGVVRDAGAASLPSPPTGEVRGGRFMRLRNNVAYPFNPETTDTYCARKQRKIVMQR